LFESFKHFDLVKSTKKEISYSRCGRTDKGVSACGNVIALNIRSNLDGKKKKEYPYLLMLNGYLPKDVRLLASAIVPDDFSARFDCRRREYKYFFPRGNLNIDKIRKAAKLFIGIHDFRNFCKIDVVTTTNFIRNIVNIQVDKLETIFPLF